MNNEPGKQDRDELRKHLRSSRSGLSASQSQSNSALICQRLEPLLQHKKHVAGYLALGKEVDLSHVAASIDASQRYYYVPVVLEKNQMMFARYNDATPMTTNQYGITEPSVDKASLVRGMELDVILVPLVGFDNQCNRMGMGGGYYDRCFEQRKTSAPPPLLIGVAHECQCVESVLPDSWDVPLDYVVTEERVIENSVGH